MALSNKFQSLNNNSLHSSKIPNSRVKINSNKISITYSLLSSALLIKQLKCLQVIKCLWEIFSIYSMVKLCQAVILLRCLCLTLTMALSKIFSTEWFKSLWILMIQLKVFQHRETLSMRWLCTELMNSKLKLIAKYARRLLKKMIGIISCLANISSMQTAYYHGLKSIILVPTVGKNCLLMTLNMRTERDSRKMTLSVILSEVITMEGEAKILMAMVVAVILVAHLVVLIMLDCIN